MPCGGVVRGVLRVAAGPPESASWAVFPAAVHRLLRGSVVGAGDCVAGRGFSEPAGFPGPGRDRGAAEPLDAVAHAASDRRGNARGGVHVGAGTVGGSGSGAGEDGRRRCDDAGSERGDAEHRARDTGESYEAFVRQLAKASGIETPTRAELARFDRSRKDRKTSNKEWQSPQDTDAKIAKMKDGRTHLAHKAEHGIDLETGAILSVTVQEASEGDSATLPATLTMAAEQVEAVQPAGAEVEEVVADKGYHSDATLVALDEIGVRSYVSEPERGRRCWQDKKTGEAPAEKRAAQRHYMDTVGVFAATEVVVFNAAAGSWWSGLSRTSTRPGGCGGCGCAATRMCASGCSSRRPVATSDCCCAG